MKTLNGLVSTSDLAKQLGVSRQRLWFIAKKYSLGVKFGGTLAFTDADVKVVRQHTRQREGQ
jgi:hypothetical protein